MADTFKSTTNMDKARARNSRILTRLKEMGINVSDSMKEYFRQFESKGRKKAAFEARRKKLMEQLRKAESRAATRAKGPFSVASTMATAYGKKKAEQIAAKQNVKKATQTQVTPKVTKTEKKAAPTLTAGSSPKLKKDKSVPKVKATAKDSKAPTMPKGAKTDQKSKSKTTVTDVAPKGKGGKSISSVGAAHKAGKMIFYRKEGKKRVAKLAVTAEQKKKLGMSLTEIANTYKGASGVKKMLQDVKKK